MSPLAALDATRLCARVDDPLLWARPIPTRERATVSPVPFSWRSMARNPHALVVSAAVGALMARDAMIRALAL